MNKKNIIIISLIVVVLIIAISIILILSLKKDNITPILIEVYDESFEIERTINVANKKEVKKLFKICNEESLDKNDVPQNLAIRNDLKIDLNNGSYFMIQTDLKEFCFYENTNTKNKMIVKMPEGLMEIINNKLNQE